MLSLWVNHGGQYISVSAFDLRAEMVNITFPKENLKYQRLKQQEEEQSSNRSSHQFPPRKRRVTGINPDS
jgi:hypothetical protein